MDGWRKGNELSQTTTIHHDITLFSPHSILFHSIPFHLRKESNNWKIKLQPHFIMLALALTAGSALTSPFTLPSPNTFDLLSTSTYLTLPTHPPANSEVDPDLDKKWQYIR